MYKEHKDKSAEWRNVYATAYKSLKETWDSYNPKTPFQKMGIACSAFVASFEQAKSKEELEAYLTCHGDFFADYFPNK